MLNTHCTRALERAAGACVSRGHHEVSVEHLLIQLLEDPNADVYLVLRHVGIDAGRLQGLLQHVLEGARSGHTGRPVFSPLLLSWLQDTWMLSSTEYRASAIRSGALLTTLVLAPHNYTSAAYADVFADVARDELRQQLSNIVAGSIEEEGPAPARGEGAAAAPGGPHGRGPETALGRFTIDFTAQAAAGEVDPVIGREAEIRQCVDILARRRKNNPIIVGEAGVGKTALVEGLALRVVNREVPGQMLGVEILGLDLGLLQAGASVKGEFENRLKSVIDEVKASPTPIILFIDEAHMMIGAGGGAGGSDAANLLKPALARGELRTIAATTWSEYKKYFEKDAALTRRFQLVKVDEPSEDNAVAMMRGLLPGYEGDHGIRILDDAVVASVELSGRYISGRQLPDKSVDLLDTCAARVAIARDARPATLLDLERRIEILGRERDALRREEAEGYPPRRERLAELEQEIAEANARRAELEEHWLAEKELVHRVVELRRRLAGDEGEGPAAQDAAAPAEKGEDGGDAPPTPAPSLEETRAELEDCQRELEALQQTDALVPVDVTRDLIASVVADWTGIPVGRMLEDQATTLLELEERLGQRIKGQKSALKAIAEGIRGSKLGLGNPRAPIGVFLMVGPSGVGKTESGLALADLLFGGERFLVSINMSEFQEKHTVSRLIGSPPGYVGFGEGGVLTEAVRQRPYSTVILDEVEKADPEVMNLFYQVFDKGELADGEGRVIDFKNTLMLMTSNLGSDVMTKLCQAGAPLTRTQIVEAIRPELVRHFKPALLARMTIVPYLPLGPESMRQIVELKLGQLRMRVRSTHQIELETDPGVVDQITQRCTEVESGARNIDHILSRTLLPMLSRAILTEMTQGELRGNMLLGLTDRGEYTLQVATPDPG